MRSSGLARTASSSGSFAPRTPERAGAPSPAPPGAVSTGLSTASAVTRAREWGTAAGTSSSKSPPTAASGSVASASGGRGTAEPHGRTFAPRPCTSISTRWSSPPMERSGRETMGVFSSPPTTVAPGRTGTPGSRSRSSTPAPLSIPPSAASLWRARKTTGPSSTRGRAHGRRSCPATVPIPPSIRRLQTRHGTSPHSFSTSARRPMEAPLSSRPPPGFWTRTTRTRRASSRPIAVCPSNPLVLVAGSMAVWRTTECRGLLDAQQPEPAGGRVRSAGHRLRPLRRKLQHLLRGGLRKLVPHDDGRRQLGGDLGGDPPPDHGHRGRPSERQRGVRRRRGVRRPSSLQDDERPGRLPDLDGGRYGSSRYSVQRRPPRSRHQQHRLCGHGHRRVPEHERRRLLVVVHGGASQRRRLRSRCGQLHAVGHLFHPRTRRLPSRLDPIPRRRARLRT